MDQPRRRRGKPKLGRPPLPKGEGKRHAIGLRVTAELRQQLEQAVKDSGRSMSQEAEFRLEQSFANDAAQGGPALSGLFMMMGGAAQFIEARMARRSWTTDWETFLAVKKAWDTLIEAAGPGKAPPEIRDEVVALIATKPTPPPHFAEERPATIDEQEESERKWHEHQAAVMVYELQLAEYQQKLVASAQRFDALANLGSSAAATFLSGSRRN